MGFDFSGYKGNVTPKDARVYTAKKTLDWIKGQEATLVTVADIPEAKERIELKIASVKQAVDDMTVEATDVLEQLKKNNIKIIAGDKDGNATNRMASIAVTSYPEKYTDKEGKEREVLRQQYAINGYNGSLIFQCGEYNEREESGDQFVAYGAKNVTFCKFNGKGKGSVFTARNQDILTSDKVPDEFKEAVKLLTSELGYVKYFSYTEDSAFIWKLREQLAKAIKEKTVQVKVDESIKKVDADGNPVLDADGKEIFEKTGNQVDKDREYVSMRSYKNAEGIEQNSIVLASRETPNQQVQITLTDNGSLFINVTNFDKLVDKEGNISDRPEGSTATNFYRPLIKKPEDAKKEITNDVLASIVEEFKTDFDKARTAAKDDKGQPDKD